MFFGLNFTMLFSAFFQAKPYFLSLLEMLKIKNYVYDLDGGGKRGFLHGEKI